MDLPDIPKSYLIALCFLSLIVLRAYQIDSYVTASIGLVVGYLVGKHYDTEYVTYETEK